MYSDGGCAIVDQINFFAGDIRYDDLVYGAEITRKEQVIIIQF